MIGVKPGKRKGQHFLTPPEIVKDIIDAASLTGGETVLEIGPGPGILTFHLAEKAREVIAVELEPAFAGFLKKEAKKSEIDNITVILGDALSMELPKFDVIVSNLPYNISTPLLFKLLPLDFDRGILMFQKEFGKRLMAPAGTKSRGVPTLKANYHAEIEGLFQVPRTAFYPVPKVDSMVLGITKRPFPHELRSRKFYFKLIDVLFQQRRKKVRNTLVLGHGRLPGAAQLEKGEFRELLDSILGRDVLEVRAEDLEVEEVVEMANVLWKELGGLEG